MASAGSFCARAQQQNRYPQEEADPAEREKSRSHIAIIFGDESR